MTILRERSGLYYYRVLSSTHYSLWEIKHEGHFWEFGQVIVSVSKEITQDKARA